MSKKEVLVLKSPFPGIMGHLREADNYARRNGIRFLGIQYTGYMSLENHSGFSYNKYAAQDFNLQFLERLSREEEVVSLRLDDVFQTAEFSGYKFQRNGELELVRDLNEGIMYSDAGPNIATIAHLANLISDRADGVMPIWSDQTGGVGFRISMENIYSFFQRIREHKKELKIKEKSVEHTSLVNFLSSNFS